MLRYGIVSAAVVAMVAALLSVVFHGSGAATAVWISAVVAVAGQAAAVLVVRAVKTGGLDLTARLGAGMLVRFVVVVAYAFVAAKFLALPLAPALLSLVVFLVSMTVLEPLMLTS